MNLQQHCEICVQLTRRPIRTDGYENVLCKER